MANDAYRAPIRTAIQNARRSFADAQTVAHAGLRGRAREILAEGLLKPVLPSLFEVGSGIIIDAWGHQTTETDLIVYSSSLVPPILFSEREGVFPAEAAFAAVEVKSRLTATELQDALRKVRTIWALKYTSGMHSDDDAPIQHTLTPVIPVLFAFGSDLTASDDFERYISHDPEWQTAPLIRAICVVGSGSWWFSPPRRGWLYHPPTDDNEEVVDFLGVMSNSMLAARASRGNPRLGRYFMLDRPIRLLPTLPGPIPDGDSDLSATEG